MFVEVAEPEVVTAWSVPNGPADVPVDVGVEVGRVDPAVAPTEFCWLTGPLSPGLSTRTMTFTLLGEVCVADAAPAPVEPAAAWESFDCATAPASPELPTRTSTFVLLGDVCVELAAAEEAGALEDEGALPVAPLDAAAEDWLPWPTDPFEPPSSTRVETLPFSGCVWVDDAPDCAFWEPVPPVSPDWSPGSLVDELEAAGEPPSSAAGLEVSDAAVSSAGGGEGSAAAVWAGALAEVSAGCAASCCGWASGAGGSTAAVVTSAGAAWVAAPPSCVSAKAAGAAARRPRAAAETTAATPPRRLVRLRRSWLPWDACRVRSSRRCAFDHDCGELFEAGRSRLRSAEPKRVQDHRLTTPRDESRIATSELSPSMAQFVNEIREKNQPFNFFVLYAVLYFEEALRDGCTTKIANAHG
ncbi:MAG TPA: hypothetical protein VGF23_05470 [Gaiellaceae bacterium]